MSVEEDQARYRRAVHAMQTGVATVMSFDPGETSPKHLRVGVNNSLVQQGALTNLLFKKGIITEEEYWKELADLMEKEVENYKLILKRHWPDTNITLH